MEKKDNIRRGDNIRILREYYDETQKDLREALITANLLKNKKTEKSGVISNYERGIREPQLDILRFISYRYNIDYDEIIDGDLAYIDNKKLDYDRIEFLISSNFFELFMFPLLTEKECDYNDNLVNALSIQLKLYKEWKYKAEDYGNLELCIDLYDKAITDGITDAYINVLSALLFVYSKLKIQIINEQSLIDKDKNFKEILLNFNNNSINNNKEIKDFIIEASNNIGITYERAKKEIKNKEILEFYSVIIYLLNFDKNVLNPKDSMKLGENKLIDLCFNNNKYALALLDFLTYIFYTSSQIV